MALVGSKATMLSAPTKNYSGNLKLWGNIGIFRYAQVSSGVGWGKEVTTWTATASGLPSSATYALIAHREYLEYDKTGLPSSCMHSLKTSLHSMQPSFNKPIKHLTLLAFPSALQKEDSKCFGNLTYLVHEISNTTHQLRSLLSASKR